MLYILKQLFWQPGEPHMQNFLDYQLDWRLREQGRNPMEAMDVAVTVILYTWEFNWKWSPNDTAISAIEYYKQKQQGLVDSCFILSKKDFPVCEAAVYLH